MAVILFKEKNSKYTNVFIFTDNEAAIQAVESPMRQSGQYIIKEILDKIDNIHETKPTGNIHIEWVPGHKNVQGNKRADQAAKAAAEPNSTKPAKRMKSAQKRSIKSMTKTKWDTDWRNGRENARHLRKMSKHPDAGTGLMLYGALQRKQVAWTARLRTGHCHLNDYLHRFNTIETPECECGAAKETADHFLLNCEIYDEERDRLRRKVGSHGMITSMLLGDGRNIKDTMKYIEETGRLTL